MQARSEETRNHIKTAAIDEFCLKGYEGASVADICGQAGVSKGAFYHHFPSKQSLFLAIMQDWLASIDIELFTRREGGKNIPQIIQEMGDTMGFVFQAASGQLPMFMEFMVQASRDKEVWDAVIAPYRLYQQKFTSLINTGKEEGSIRQDVEAEATALVLMSLAIGILLQGVVNPSAADWENVTKNGVQMILDGVKGRTE